MSYCNHFRVCLVLLAQSLHFQVQNQHNLRPLRAEFLPVLYTFEIDFCLQKYKKYLYLCNIAQRNELLMARMPMPRVTASPSRPFDRLETLRARLPAAWLCRPARTPPGNGRSRI